mmetsp:Transcript_2135/g.3941  ORF Transcript_2135/g.3941 Transcript_2135/m.3941 type:complete len:97 (-) Transcript_2135:1775-2065(-)
MSCSLSNNDTKCTEGNHNGCHHNDFDEYFPSNSRCLVVFVLVAGVKVKGHYVHTPESFSILPMLMLQTKKAPDCPSKKLHHHRYCRKIRRQFEFSS